MIYDIVHRTTYAYSAPVSGARCVIRLTPIERPGQRVIAHALTTVPAGTLTPAVDYFGNRVARLAVAGAHDRLTIEARSTVAVTARPVTAERGPTVEAARREIVAATRLDGEAAVHGLFPSRHVPLVEAITLYAGASLAAGRPIAAAADELNRRIYADFIYDPEATDVGAAPATVFRARRGVCQDFAHVMIAGFRGNGLAARYVSGYLRTKPPPGQPRLEGADAMHAWVEIHAGAELGWIGFDPTNGIAAGLDHVVVAVGRDYGDVSPVDGVFRATGGQDLVVAVDVVPRDESADGGEADVDEADGGEQPDAAVSAPA